MLRNSFVVIVLTIPVLLRNRFEYVTKKPIEKEREKFKIQETKKKSKAEIKRRGPRIWREVLKKKVVLKVGEHREIKMSVDRNKYKRICRKRVSTKEQHSL